MLSSAARYPARWPSPDPCPPRRHLPFGVGRARFPGVATPAFRLPDRGPRTALKEYQGFQGERKFAGRRSGDPCDPDVRGQCGE